MKVALVIHSVIPVAGYGGTQRVMWGLASALSDMGHEVTLVAPEGSKVPAGGRLITADFTQPLAPQLPADVDVIHFNDRVPQGEIPAPHIVTIHGNSLHEPIDANAVFVSRNHAERFGSSQYVYNGLYWADYPEAYLTKSRCGFTFLGKAAWRVKNVAAAIKLTLRAGSTLEVLGGTRLNLKMGFRLTLSPRIHFHGTVDDTQKARYLEQSQGLLFPVTWDEPFGLAVIESMYYGAPVYASPYGSLPELITPDTGIVAATAEDMLATMQSGKEFSPEACHRRAAEVFSAETMATAYLEKYSKVIAGERLNPIAPHPIKPYERYRFTL